MRWFVNPYSTFFRINLLKISAPIKPIPQAATNKYNIGIPLLFVTCYIIYIDTNQPLSLEKNNKIIKYFCLAKPLPAKDLRRRGGGLPNRFVQYHTHSSFSKKLLRVVQM